MKGGVIMGHSSNIITTEESSRLDLYTELQKGLKSIEAGRTKTAEDVQAHMLERRKKYYEGIDKK